MVVYEGSLFSRFGVKVAEVLYIFITALSYLTGRLYAPVAQLDRALVCGTRGRAFESRRVYQIEKVSIFVLAFCFVKHKR